MSSRAQQRSHQQQHHHQQVDSPMEGRRGASGASASTAQIPAAASEQDPGMVDEDESEELDEDEQLQRELQRQQEAQLDAVGQHDMPVEGDEEDEEEEEEEEEYDESESSSQSGTDSLTWISWYCSLPGHEYFAEVSVEFIEDDFNLTGLSQLVPFYKEALEMVLDADPEEESLKIPDMSIVESSAELLYGLIHQRYIITRQGLQQMVAKYESGHFGFCPRVYCNQTRVLPSGRSDLPGVDGVKLFCPNCLDTYTPPSSRFNGVDGAFFGTTFPHLLFQQHPELVPVLNNPPQPPVSSSSAGSGTGRSPSVSPADANAKEASPESTSNASSTLVGEPGTETATPTLVGGVEGDKGEKAVTWTTPQSSAMKLYIPRIYGFKVSERARSGPRMQWLRMRPTDLTEVDRVNYNGRWKAPFGNESRRSAPMSATNSNQASSNPRASTSAQQQQSNVRPSRSRQKLGASAPSAPPQQQSQSSLAPPSLAQAAAAASLSRADSVFRDEAMRAVDDSLPPRKSYSNTPSATTPRGRDGQSPNRARKA